MANETLNLYLTTKGAEQGQIQVQGAPNPTGKPLSKVNKVKVTLASPKGATLVLVLGDTHSAWPSHQAGGKFPPGLFEALLEIGVGTKVPFTISQVEVMSGGGATLPDISKFNF